MNKIIPLLFVLIICTALVSSPVAQQDSSLIKLLTKEQLTDCPTYILNAKRLIPVYYLNNQIDSIDILINFLEHKCGAFAGEFGTLRNLLGIERGNFGDPTCDDEIQADIFGKSRSYWSDIFFSRGTLCGPDDSDYNIFIETLVQKLMASNDSTSVANLYCHYLLREYDYILKRLHEGAYKGSCLREAYTKEISEVQIALRNELRGYYGFSGGVWIPQDGAKIVGKKIELGAQAGFHKRRLIYSLSAIIRFLSSANSYDVVYDGKLTPTKKFLGGYFGTEVGLETIRTGRFALDLFAGVGYDGWEAINKGEDEHKSINSFNINLGSTARIFYNKERTRFWGLQGRYNFVKYSNAGGTNLRGNTISISLIYGYLTSPAVGRARRLLVYD